MSDFLTDYLNNTSTSASLAVGGSNTGYIGVNADRDWFRITLTAGSVYSFRQFTVGLPEFGGQAISLASPSLRLRDASGNQLKAGKLSVDGKSSDLTNFTPLTTGTYYIDAGASTNTDRGFYTVTATQIDDFAGKISPYNPDLTFPYYVNPKTNSLTGNIQFDSDKDLYKVTLSAGLLYSFSLNTSGKGGSLSNPALRLLNSSNKPVASNDDVSIGNPNSYFIYTPKADGVYYLEATGSSSTDRGSYSISYSQVDDFLGTIAPSNPDLTPQYYDANKTRTQAAGIQFGGDKDLFKVTLAAGYLYRFSQTTTGQPGSLDDPSLVLLDGARKRVAGPTDPTSKNDSFTFTPKTSSTYYLQAGAVLTTDRGAYSVSAQQVDDFLGSTSTTGNLTYVANNQWTAAVDFNKDSDWFRMDLTGGMRYAFNMISSGQPGSLSDPYLLLHNSTGALVSKASNNDISATNKNSLFYYTPTSSGTFYLEAKSNSVTDQGTYIVDVDPTDDNLGLGSPVNVYGLARLNLGDSINGSIQFDKDTDWFGIYLEGGRTYRFTETTSGQPGSLADPFLKLRDQTGAQVPKALNDNIGTNPNSFFTYTPTTSNWFILEAGAATPTDRGTYTVNVF
jgi:hypothetical protein